MKNIIGNIYWILILIIPGSIITLAKILLTPFAVLSYKCFGNVKLWKITDTMLRTIE